MDLLKALEALKARAEKPRIIPVEIIRFAPAPTNIMELVERDRRSVPTTERLSYGIRFEPFSFEIQCNCTVCQMRQLAQDAEEQDDNELPF